MSPSSTPVARGSSSAHPDGEAPTTTAAFAPRSYSSSVQQRSTILVHQKSPLLLATPPQVTRTLAYSHAFILPLNKVAGLLSWTTGDPWESFLLVATFWLAVLYGDVILRFAGPFILVLFLILGLYLRRYSPLSSTGWNGEKKHARSVSSADTPVEHRKSLDEILATLQAFTGRCDILLAPMIHMTDFLSTQQTATSATTRPALTTLFVRILLASPVWLALTLPPLRIVTATRIVLLAGTTILTFHSRPARISRAIVWRSRTVRHLAGLITGLDFKSSDTNAPSRSPFFAQSNMAALKSMKSKDQRIRFTFSLYENQRRWIGLGWTSNMIAYERAPWTDEHLNAAAAPDRFELPQIEGGLAEWRWVEGSRWSIHTGAKATNNGTNVGKLEEEAWVYFDNKWLNGTRGQDGWSKYTRRRKWVRDAELVDVKQESPSTTTTSARNDAESKTSGKASGIAQTQAKSAADKGTGASAKLDQSRAGQQKPSGPANNVGRADGASATGSESTQLGSSPSKRGWFGHTRDQSDTHPFHSMSESSVAEAKIREKLSRLPPASHTRTGSQGSKHSTGTGSQDTGARGPTASVTSGSGASGTKSERERRRDEGQDVYHATERLKQRDSEWGVDHDVSMGLG